MWSNCSPTLQNCGCPTLPERWTRCAATSGATALRQAVAAVEAVTRTEHAIVGEVYAAADDSNYALGRITCIAHHWSESDGKITDLVWHLRYDDEYMRTRSGWRIHGRALTINAIETRPVRRLRGRP